MANTTSGVFPCYKNQFQVGASGSSGTMNQIANCEEFSVSIDNNVEEWTAFESEGWTSRLMTGKGVKISVKAKRTIGDTGNDLIAGLAFKNGTEAEVDFQWTFPDGTKIVFSKAVISVTALGTGNSTNVGPLEFDVMSNGKPTITPAV